MKNKKIVIFKDNEFTLDVKFNNDTVWLNQDQMVDLFGRNQSVISRHINKALEDGEIDEKSNMQKMHIAKSDKPVKYYDLDVIISVGYRVKSSRGVIFRKWATNVLKQYLLEGYVENKKRLNQLEKSLSVVKIARRLDSKILSSEAESLLNIILNYNVGLNLLNDYDNQSIIKPSGSISEFKISYEQCLEVINNMKYKEKSNLFALERDNGLTEIIGTIYQTYNGKDVYETTEEKAANFLYLIVKNHVFIDGNKRIAAILFIYILNFYNLLYKNGKQIISNNTLVSLTLLIAESNPKEKEIMISITMNFLNN